MGKESYEKIKNQDLVDLKENSENLKKIEKIKSLSESIQSDIVIIDKYANEVKDLQEKIDHHCSLLDTEMTDSCNESCETSPLEVAKNKKMLTQERMEELNKKIKNYQEDINMNYKRQDVINTLKEK